MPSFSPDDLVIEFAKQQNLSQFNTNQPLPPLRTFDEFRQNARLENGVRPSAPTTTDWDPSIWRNPDRSPPPPNAPRLNLKPPPIEASPSQPRQPVADDLFENLTKQPRPNTVAPPPTPNTGGARAPLTMTEPPTPAQPRSPTPPASNIPGARPSNVPEPAGVGANRLGGGVGAGAGAGIVNAGFRLLQGQSPGQALGGGIATGVGTGIGTVVGAAAGSVLGVGGAYVGGAVGGAIGGMAGSALFDAFFPSTPAPAEPKPDPIQSPSPFLGGQSPGVVYIVTIYFNDSISGDPDRKFYDYRETYAPVEDLIITYPGEGLIRIGFNVRDSAGNVTEKFLYSGSQENLKVAKIVDVVRADGQPDTGGNPPSPPLQQDTRPVVVVNQTINQSAPPRATPAAGANPTPQNYAPSSNVAGGSHQAAVGGAQPLPWTPTAAPAGSPPASQPYNHVAPLPASAPAGSPQSSGAPAGTTLTSPFGGTATANPDGTVTFVTPGSPAASNPQTNAQNQAFPSVGSSSGFSSSTNPTTTNTPAATATTVKPQPVPDVNSPVPKLQPAPSTQPAQSPVEVQFKELQDKFEELNNTVLQYGIGLVGITKLAEGIANNTKPENLKPTVADAVCSTTQPGGCTNNLVNNAANNINQNTNNGLGGLNAALNSADLGLLAVINNKMGDQITGGLSGGLGRLSKFLGIDRIFNLLNFLAILHNASILSASLKITLLETLSSVGNATGLLQTSEGDNVDLNQVFNQGVEGLITSLIGTEAYASMKLSWRKYSSIYRAGANVLSNVGNMFSSIGNGIEVVGERTGKIGNALRAAGVVRENAYNFMSENMTVHTNKFMTFQTNISGVTEVLEAINEVAESTIEGQQSYTEAVKATTEFKKSLAEGTKEQSKDVENAAIQAEAVKIKENLTKDPTGEDEEGLLSFLTDR